LAYYNAFTLSEGEINYMEIQEIMEYTLALLAGFKDEFEDVAGLRSCWMIIQPS